MNGLAARIAIAILAISASGQSPKQPRQPVPSPEEIIRIVKAASSSGNEDLSRLWRALHTERSEDLVCAFGCAADVVTTEPLLVDPGKSAVVRVCVREGLECRFLVLHSREGNWTLIDYVDSGFNKYSTPTAQVQTAGNRRWLVIQEFGGGGTGVLLKLLSWYELHEGRFRAVLSVPDYGHDYSTLGNGTDPGRTFKSEFLGFEQTPGVESLLFRFKVAFKTPEDDQPLWKDDWKVAYSRTGREPKFTFDSARSGISKELALAVFNINSLDVEKFVLSAFDHLMEIANKSPDPRRAWLKSFLDENPRIRELHAVKKAFDTAAKK